MKNSIYIAENSTDMFEIEIPQPVNVTAEVQTKPIEEKPTELEHFASKSLISFGTMAICIVVILLIALIFKKKKVNVPVYAQNDVVYNQEIEQEVIQEIPQEQTVRYTKPRQVKRQTLNTPSNLTKCIKSFLENTKDI